MGPSDLPVCTQAQRHRPKGMGVHIRQIMRACDTTGMYHDGQLITQANMRLTTDLLYRPTIKFNYGSAQLML